MNARKNICRIFFAALLGAVLLLCSRPAFAQTSEKRYGPLYFKSCEQAYEHYASFYTRIVRDMFQIKDYTYLINYHGNEFHRKYCGKENKTLSRFLDVLKETSLAEINDAKDVLRYVVKTDLSKNVPLACENDRSAQDSVIQKIDNYLSELKRMESTKKKQVMDFINDHIEQTRKSLKAKTPDQIREACKQDSWTMFDHGYLPPQEDHPLLLISEGFSALVVSPDWDKEHTYSTYRAASDYIRRQKAAQRKDEVLSSSGQWKLNE